MYTLLFAIAYVINCLISNYFSMADAKDVVAAIYTMPATCRHPTSFQIGNGKELLITGLIAVFSCKSSCYTMASVAYNCAFQEA